MTSEFFAPPEVCRGAVTIGNFDGVHRGHQAMIEALAAAAQRDGCPAVAVTFHPHPLSLLRPAAAPPLLTTVEHRTELLRRLGVDHVVVLSATRELLRLSAAEFFEQIVLQQLQARRLVEGPNFFFGRDRGGNITVLRGLCSVHGVQLDVIEPVTVNGQWVSSSVIRSLLQDGDLNDAVALLGHPYRLSGRVTTGAQRGREIGFPTANLDEIATVVPGPGVYAGRCRVDGATHLAAVHIGPNPTFADDLLKVEVHLLQFAGDLYFRTLEVDLVARVRDVQRFESAEALRRQLQHDLSAVIELVGP